MAAVKRAKKPMRQDNDSPPPISPASVALADAQVDLIRRIREGIPEREYVPGGEPWLLAGKRYLMPAPTGDGKSLVGLVICVGCVHAGGTAAILDVENGADEYARRLEDVLVGRDGSADGALAEACSERLRYYEWPRLSVKWEPEDWVAALASPDLTVFDSSRLLLSSTGLDEDSNDDYARFASALLVPLSTAGVTTLTLDNTGHEAKDRARGASAKADLNEATYVVKQGKTFDRDVAGHVKLTRKRSRFTDLPQQLYVPLGGGTYGPVTAEVPVEQMPTDAMEHVSLHLEKKTPLSRTKIYEVVGAREKTVKWAIECLEKLGHIRTDPGGQGKPILQHFIKPYRAPEGSDA